MKREVKFLSDGLVFTHRYKFAENHQGAVFDQPQAKIIENSLNYECLYYIMGS